MLWNGIRYGLSVVILSTAMLGCVTYPTPEGRFNLVELIQQADAKAEDLVGSGNVDGAIELLGEVAESNPSRKEPWIKLAKIYFDSKDYGNAIVAADEALKRDDADQMAKGVRVVAGLRVAAQSLADLRNDANLQGSARTEAMSLAAVLRSTLGEDVLVPPASAKDSKAASSEAGNTRKLPPARSVSSSPPRSAVVSAPMQRPEAKPALNGDPFSVLK
jgi:tetratricopeptide (TPR) repeat protein